MQSTSVRTVLEEIAFAWSLKPRHLDILANMATEEMFEEGDMIFYEGDQGDKLYLVEEGRISVEVNTPGRGRAVILTVGPGQLLGWSSLFPLKRKTAFGRALTPVRAIALDAKALRQACDADHDLGHAIGWLVAELIADRLKATRMQLLDIFASDNYVQ